MDSLLGTEPIGMLDLIYTEILQGFTSDRDYQQAKQLLDWLVFFNAGGKEMALKSAEHYRLLRKRGVTIRKTVDTIIATFCIHHDFTLLHADRDFEAFVKHLNLRVL